MQCVTKRVSGFHPPGWVTVLPSEHKELLRQIVSSGQLRARIGADPQTEENRESLRWSSDRAAQLVRPLVSLLGFLCRPTIERDERMGESELQL